MLRIALAVAAPLVVVGGLELVLRLVGFGQPTSFFIRDESAPGLYRTNPHFTQTFFPASFGLKPANFRLPKEKPADTFRVFVLGESAAMGIPEPGFGLAPLLEAQLADAAGGRTVQVHNLAVTAINSHVVRCIAEEALEFDPDLLVLYMGNNEVVGPYGPGSTVTQGTPPLPVIRAAIRARQTRLGQLLHRMLGALGRHDATAGEWRGMETFVGHLVPGDDPRLESVYQNFEHNLRNILAAARGAGVPVVLSTVAVNLRDCAPFASVHSLGEDEPARAEWQALVDEAQRTFVEEAFAQSEAKFQRAVELDPRHAETRFMLGRLIEARGDDAAAMEQFRAALQWDALRFRADDRINAIIRETASGFEGVHLVDAADQMLRGEDASGARYFFEHVHLTWEGNVRLSQAIAGAVAELQRDRPTLTPPVQNLAAALGFTDFGRLIMLMEMDELTARPPFTQQFTYAEDRTRLATDLALVRGMLESPGSLAGARAVINRARQADPDNLFLWSHEAAIARDTGDLAAALALLDELAEHEPWSPELALQQAFLLHQLGRSDEAEARLLEAADRAPYYFQTYTVLGVLWMSKGEREKGRDYFTRRVEEFPGSLPARHMLANFLAAESAWAEAEEQWRQILRLRPDDEAALEQILRRLFSRGRDEEAVALLEAAHAYNPKNADVNARLVQYHQTHRNAEAQAKYLGALVESGPVPAALLLERVIVLQRLGRHDEARTQLFRARRMAQAQDDELTLEEVTDRLRQLGVQL